MAGQPQRRAAEAVGQALQFGVAGLTARQLGSKPGTSHRAAVSRLPPLPDDVALGQEGRRVLLCLACDEGEDSRVRVIAARELVALGVAAEERERLAKSEEVAAVMAMSDAELEAIVARGQ